MKIIVTGSSGHLGEALVRQFSEWGHRVIGIDVLPSPYTTVVGSILDLDLINGLMESTDAILHTATLHKPHIATHSKHQFIDVNVHGTQILLDAAVRHRVGAFIFPSTTSSFGHAMSPSDSEPAVWVTEQLVPVPKNIYGVSKLAAEALCQLMNREHGLPCIVLKTSRFFPEDDDMKGSMDGYSQDNVKAIEFLSRRVDLEDVVMAHKLAVERAANLKFEKFIISATTPFSKIDCEQLNREAPKILRTYFPDYEELFASRGWRMVPSISRVYVNELAREKLGWRPKHDFGEILKRLRGDEGVLSDFARKIGVKGYHNQFSG